MGDLSTGRKLVIAGCFVFMIAVSQVRPIERPMDSRSGSRPREEMTLYDGYSTPAWVLHGIAVVESGEDDGAVGDDGISVGRMQLNEEYREARISKWGWYDPYSPADAVRIASCIIAENMRHYEGRPDQIKLAVNAYNAGWNVSPSWGYYDRVVEAGVVDGQP